MAVRQKLQLDQIYQPVARELELVKIRLKTILRDTFSILDDPSYEETIIGGKQIRPALVLLSAGLCGAPVETEPYLNLAATSELVHIASLIHDDVVDNAAIRHGGEAANVRWDNKLAVLTGDYIISQALCILNRYRNLSMMETIVSTFNDMSHGELLQTARSRDDHVSEAEYLDMIRRKTGSLMSAVCVMPSQLCSAERERVAALASYGFNFGMAFQLTDDLLDLTSNEDVLGKPSFCDIADGKETLPIIHLSTVLRGEDSEHLTRILYKRSLEDGDTDWIIAKLKSHGSHEYCFEMAKTFTLRAKGFLDIFPDVPYRRSLIDICDYVLGREK